MPAEPQSPPARPRNQSRSRSTRGWAQPARTSPTAQAGGGRKAPPDARPGTGLAPAAPWSARYETTPEAEASPASSRNSAGLRPACAKRGAPGARLRRTWRPSQRSGSPLTTQGVTPLPGTDSQRQSSLGPFMSNVCVSANLGLVDNNPARTQPCAELRHGGNVIGFDHHGE